MLLTDFAAYSHGGADWTEAFEHAVQTIRQQGGGVLTVPAGVYLTGPIRLTGNMTLDIQSGAEIRFLQDLSAFPLVDLEFEGIPSPCYMPCLYARGEENITVTGYGTLNGQGSSWWKLLREGALEHPRPYLMCFDTCRHVVLENVTLTQSPCWTVHPLRCDQVVLRGLLIRNPYDSPNTDGIDPDGCRNVLITGCTVDVGDDCIAIKSGTEDTPNPQPSESIIITNCHFLHGHGGVVMGSEMSGGIRNVVVSSCVFRQTDRGVRLKTRRFRGGAVESIQLDNLLMEQVMCPFVFNMFYECGKNGRTPEVRDKNPRPVDDKTPLLRDVRITNVTARSCGACAGFFYGLPERPVEGISLTNVLVEMDENAPAAKPAMMEEGPVMKGAGFYLRNARRVDLSGVTVLGVRGELTDTDDSVQLSRPV